MLFKIMKMDFLDFTQILSWIYKYDPTHVWEAITLSFWSLVHMLFALVSPLLLIKLVVSAKIPPFESWSVSFMTSPPFYKGLIRFVLQSKGVPCYNLQCIINISFVHACGYFLVHWAFHSLCIGDLLYLKRLIF